MNADHWNLLSASKKMDNFSINSRLALDQNDSNSINPVVILHHLDSQEHPPQFIQQFSTRMRFTTPQLRRRHHPPQHRNKNLAQMESYFTKTWIFPNRIRGVPYFPFQTFLRYTFFGGFQGSFSVCFFGRFPTTTVCRGTRKRPTEIPLPNQ